MFDGSCCDGVMQSLMLLKLPNIVICFLRNRRVGCQVIKAVAVFAFPTLCYILLRASYNISTVKKLEFLANVNSRSRTLYVVVCPSVICLSFVVSLAVVCLSVTFMHPIQAIQIFLSHNT